MCLEGGAGPLNVWLSRCVGAGTVPTSGTTNTPCSEEGVISGVGHVETTMEFEIIDGQSFDRRYLPLGHVSNVTFLHPPTKI